MFEFIRTHQRLMQFLLLLIIFPSFAFFGLESYTRMSDKEPTVAKVAGQSITQREWDAAQSRQLERFRQMFGEQFNVAVFDTPEARQGVLENLVAQKALAAYVVDNHLTVSDETLRKTISQIEGLVGADGKFDMKRYQDLLTAQGLTTDKFEASLRRDMAIQQSNAAVQGSAFSPKTVSSHIARLNQQVRDVQELAFTVTNYKSQVKISDAKLQDFYTKHAEQFQLPEVIKAEFVVLAPDVVESKITVSEADIKTYYEQNISRYKADEQRRASHILISANKDMPAAQKNAAKEKAEKLLAQLKKNPNDFAKLAKENSQDPGSAERGGDLDFFGKGMMVKPFEEAAYALKEGEISNLVQSDFGYHIIRLTAIKPAATRKLEEVKANLIDEIKQQQVGKKFAEMSEIFTNLVYEQPDSLKPVADKLGLKIETVSGLTKKSNPAMPKVSSYNQPKFLNALFADDVVHNKQNTEAIEVAPRVLIAGRVLEYKPVTKIPLADVRSTIEDKVSAIEAEQLTLSAGIAKLAELKKGASAEFGNAMVVSRNKPANLPPAALEAVMRVSTATLPAFVGVTIPGRGYSIFRINKIEEVVADEAAMKAEQQQIDEFLSTQETAAYLAIIKKRAKAEIIKPADLPKVSTAPTATPAKP